MRDWPKKIEYKHPWAVFLDRDGTINVDTHYPHRVEELEFLPGAVQGLRTLVEFPCHILVVSNQAGIALGYFTKEQMSEFNAELRARAESAGGRIDAFYYCPYLEPKHLPPGADVHDCAKPFPGMLMEASADFGLDLGRSFMIGDKTSDIAAGQRAGCVTILVKTGKAGKEEGALDVSPDYCADSLASAADIVRSHFQRPDRFVSQASGDHPVSS